MIMSYMDVYWHASEGKLGAVIGNSSFLSWCFPQCLYRVCVCGACGCC